MPSETASFGGLFMSLLIFRIHPREFGLGRLYRWQNIVLDRGNDTGVVHRGLELLHITGYIPAFYSSNSPETYCFYYLPQEDAFCCREGTRVVYQWLNCSQTTGKALKYYQV